MANPTRAFVCMQNVLDHSNVIGTATPALAATMPMSHLKLSSRGRTARSVGNPATQQYRFTFGGTGYYMNFFSWYRHNFLPGLTWQVRGYATTDWTGAPVFDTGVVQPYSSLLLGDYGAQWGYLPLGYNNSLFLPQPRFSTIFFDRVGVLSIQVDITNPGMAEGFLDVSRVFAGDGTELSYNPDSYGLATKSDGKMVASAGGSPRVDGAYTYRVLSMNVPWVSVAQRAIIADMQRYAGTEKDVFVSLFPSETGELRRDHELIGKVLEARDIELPKSNPYGIHATSFKIREM
jgi:hypothetical protein